MAKGRKVRRARRGRQRPVEVEPAAPVLSKEEQFREDYAYVIKDLRQVFIIAAAMFALLILLNLVLA